MRRLIFLSSLISVVLAVAACDGAAPFDEDTDEPGLSSGFPAKAADYRLHNGSFLASFSFPDAANGDLCCRDFGEISRDFITDGTSKNDNGLALLDYAVTKASKGAVNLTAPIMNAIRLGRFVPLLDHVGVPTTDGSYQLAYFGGVPVEGAEYAAVKDGGGEFLLDAADFEAGTGTPAFLFENATVKGGKLNATNGHFELPLPIGWGLEMLTVQRAQIKAEIAIVDGGVLMNNGDISGMIKVDDWFKAYNRVVAQTCACAGLTQDVYGRGPSGWESHCLTEEQGSCVDDARTACGVLLFEDIKKGGMCGALFAGVAAAADLDLDGDTSTYEGMSIGLHFTGVDATSTGLAE